MEDLKNCNYFDIPYVMPLVKYLDSNNLSAFYRTIADSIKGGEAYWNCLNLRCKECMFHTKRCEMNFCFTTKEWVSFMLKDVGYIMANYKVNNDLIKQMIKDKMKNE